VKCEKSGNSTQERDSGEHIGEHIVQTRWEKRMKMMIEKIQGVVVDL